MINVFKEGRQKDPNTCERTHGSGKHQGNGCSRKAVPYLRPHAQTCHTKRSAPGAAPILRPLLEKSPPPS